MFSVNGAQGSPAPPRFNHVQERLLQCSRGQHDLEEVFGTGENGGGERKVVRWCRVCGAVVVDMDVDGRVIKGNITKMRAPDVSQAAFLSLGLG